MSADRKPSAFADLDLTGVERHSSKDRPPAVEIDGRSTMPRRDPMPEKEGTEQLNMRLGMSQYHRFVDLCRREGKSRPKMLATMMDIWEGR